MYKYAIRWLCTIALLVSAGTARATFHLWQLNEIYSNADGTVQFIELITSVGGQQFLAGRTITSSQVELVVGPYGQPSSQVTKTQSFTFPSDLPGDTAGKTFLIGTAGFAALGLMTPDYIVPNGFLYTSNGSVNFAGVDSVSWTALPVDGVMSIDRFVAMAINSPKNFAGATGSVFAPSAPTCTLTATPASISAGDTSTLTANCSPAATSYVWTGGTCAGTRAASCVVTPSASTTYTVAGINSAGTGAAASATVTVTVPAFISQSECLFNWAEENYPSQFAPAGAISNTVAPYYYRYYPQTNAYLATSTADNHVYYLGPSSNNSILDVGALSPWLSTAGCQ